MIHQVGVPEKIAKILTYPEKVNKANIQVYKIENKLSYVEYTKDEEKRSQNHNYFI